LFLVRILFNKRATGSTTLPAPARPRWGLEVSMAKHCGEQKIEIVDEERNGVLWVYLAGNDGVIDLAAHYNTARPSHRLVALRAARRVLQRQIAKIDRLIRGIVR
jgi:hypothetical protein